MKLEQDTPALSLSKYSKQLEQPVSPDIDEFDEPKQKGLDLRPVWKIIQRNLLLITGTTTVVAAAALYAGLSAPRTYEGSFQLLVEPITSEAKNTDPSALAREGEDPTNEVDYPTLLQMLKSPGMLSTIAERIQTRYPEASYDSLSSNLAVARVGPESGNEALTDETKVIEVRYKDQDPNKAQFVLAELARGYLKYSLEDRKTSISEGVQFIEDQLPILRQRVNKLEGELQALQQRYKLSDPTGEGVALANQAREIEAQKLETQRELREQRTLYANLQKQLELTPKQAIAASTLTEDPRYQDLLKQLKQIEAQIAIESARFTEESPVTQSLREQQRNLSLLLNQETRRILGSEQPSAAGNPQASSFQSSTSLGLIKQLADTANQVQVLEVRGQEIARAAAVIDPKVEQFPDIIRQYNGLQRQLQIATRTLDQLLTQRETLRVEAAQKQVPWEVVSMGNPMAIPRDIEKKLAMGVIGGFLLGLGAALLRERYRDIFYTAEDIQASSQLPLLGVIPSLKHPQQLSNIAAVTGSEETATSLFQEAFDSLYANIHFLGSEPVHSLVVSSAMPGDGKTTVALSLAQAAAAMGQRVLLVDANLHFPQLHMRLGLPNRQGLSNLLRQNLDMNNLIQRSPLQDNLFVLTSGQLLPNASRLMASAQMQRLMAQFQANFDLVIYDTPHLLGPADTNFLAEHTDGILMVVGVGKTNRSKVMQVLARLRVFHLPILGVVANHIEASGNQETVHIDQQLESEELKDCPAAEGYLAQRSQG